MKRISIAVCASVCLFVTSRAHATNQPLIVPAFFPLNTQTDASATDWNRIAAVGSKVAIVVALGGTGGFETCGVGTCSVSAAQSQFNTNYTAGQKVFGYVDSAFATNATLVTSTSVGVAAWNSKYGSYIQGIFVDDGLTFDPSQSSKSESDFQTYYETAYASITGSPYYYEVFLNALSILAEK